LYSSIKEDRLSKDGQRTSNGVSNWNNCDKQLQLGQRVVLPEAIGNYVSMTAAAVIVVLLAFLGGRFALKGKGAPAAKLAAYLLIIIVVWVLIASQSVGTADHVASAGAGGASGAISGLIHFLNDLFG
jgi:hypothetical protein